MRVFLLIATCVLTAAGLFAGERAGPPQQNPFVTVNTVGSAESVEVRRYTGHITTESRVDLVARVSGELIRQGFKEGDFVEKGQVLCELDPVRYEAAVKNTEAQIAETRARLAYAELSYNRSEKLFNEKAGTKDAMDSSQSEYNAAQASLLAAEAQLITTRDDLKNTKIIAPISGKIGVTNFTEGNYLTPSSGIIATIVQMDPLRVNFSMSNRDFLAMFGTEKNLKSEANIGLKLADGRMYDHQGTVEFIDNQANARTDTIQIYANFANPEGVLLPGSTVQVFLSRRDGSTLPSVFPSAVMHDSRSAYVYVVDRDNRVERRDVELGPITADAQLIKSGIKAGELVVVDGTHKTRPGGVIDPDFQEFPAFTMNKDTRPAAQ